MFCRCCQKLGKKVVKGSLVCLLCGLMVCAHEMVGHTSPARMDDHTHEEGGVPHHGEVYQVGLSANTNTTQSAAVMWYDSNSPTTGKVPGA
jgi:hypothetical protein